MFIDPCCAQKPAHAANRLQSPTMAKITATAFLVSTGYGAFLREKLNKKRNLPFGFTSSACRL